MQEDEANPAEQQVGRGLPALPAMVAYERPRRDIGFHFVDQVAREAKSVAGLETITANSYRCARRQPAPAARGRNDTARGAVALRAQRRPRAVRVRGGEAGQGRPARRSESKPAEKRPAWQQALASARLPLYDVHWTPAIVVEKPGGKKNEAWRVGLADGRILPLSIDNAAAQRKLALHDVVLVRPVEHGDASDVPLSDRAETADGPIDGPEDAAVEARSRRRRASWCAGRAATGVVHARGHRLGRAVSTDLVGRRDSERRYSIVVDTCGGGSDAGVDGAATDAAAMCRAAGPIVVEAHAPGSISALPPRPRPRPRRSDNLLPVLGSPRDYGGRRGRRPAS